MKRSLSGFIVFVFCIFIFTACSQNSQSSLPSEEVASSDTSDPHTPKPQNLSQNSEQEHQRILEQSSPDVVFRVSENGTSIPSRIYSTPASSSMTSSEPALEKKEEKGQENLEVAQAANPKNPEENPVVNNETPAPSPAPSSENAKKDSEEVAKEETPSADNPKKEAEERKNIEVNPKYKIAKNKKLAGDGKANDKAEENKNIGLEINANLGKLGVNLIPPMFKGNNEGEALHGAESPNLSLGGDLINGPFANPQGPRGNVKVFCDENEVVTGFVVASGNVIDSIRLICSNINAVHSSHKTRKEFASDEEYINFYRQLAETKRFGGGNGGSLSVHLAPPGFVASGFEAPICDNVIGRFRPIYKALSKWGGHDIEIGGEGVGGFCGATRVHNIDQEVLEGLRKGVSRCSEGLMLPDKSDYVMTGITGYTGNYVDNAAAFCKPVKPEDKKKPDFTLKISDTNTIALSIPFIQHRAPAPILKSCLKQGQDKVNLISAFGIQIKASKFLGYGGDSYLADLWTGCINIETDKFMGEKFWKNPDKIFFTQLPQDFNKKDLAGVSCVRRGYYASGIYGTYNKNDQRLYSMGVVCTAIDPQNDEKKPVLDSLTYQAPVFKVTFKADPSEIESFEQKCPAQSMLTGMTATTAQVTGRWTALENFDFMGLIAPPSIQCSKLVPDKSEKNIQQSIQAENKPAMEENQNNTRTNSNPGNQWLQNIMNQAGVNKTSEAKKVEQNAVAPENKNLIAKKVETPLKGNPMEGGGGERKAQGNKQNNNIPLLAGKTGMLAQNVGKKTEQAPSTQLNLNLLNNNNKAAEAMHQPNKSLLNQETQYYALALGLQHSCVMSSEGKVWCWGANDYGQLGDGSFQGKTTPVSVQSTVKASEITAGLFHNCMIGDESSVYCWGDNSQAQLAEKVGKSSTPIPPVWGQIADNRLLAKKISAWGSHTFAAHPYGQLVQVGDWTPYPNWSMGPSRGEERKDENGQRISDVVLLVSASYETCITKKDKTLWCGKHGGDGLKPIEGNPQISNIRNEFILQEIKDANENPFTKIINLAGAGICAQAPNQSVWCFRPKNAGGFCQLKFQDDENQCRRNGEGHFCAVQENGTVWCWGANFYGETGSDAKSFNLIPSQVGQIDNALKVVVGAAHSCVLKKDGYVLCWGDNSYGQLGDGTNTSRARYYPVILPDGKPLSEIVDIAAGPLHTCAIKNNTEVYCWGNNNSGQLGNGSSEIVLFPVKVSLKKEP